MEYESPFDTPKTQNNNSKEVYESPFDDVNKDTMQYESPFDTQKTPAQLMPKPSFNDLYTKGLRVGYSALSPSEQASIDSAYASSATSKQISLDQVHARMDANAQASNQMAQLNREKQQQYSQDWSHPVEDVKSLFGMAVDAVKDYATDYVPNKLSTILNNPTSPMKWMTPEAQTNLPIIAKTIKNNPAKTAVALTTPFMPEMGIPAAMALAGATEGADKGIQYLTGENKDNLKDNLIDVGGASVTGGITNSFGPLLNKGIGSVAKKIASNDAKYANEMSAYEDAMHNAENAKQMNEVIDTYVDYWKANNFKLAKERMALDLRDQGITPDQITDYEAAKWVKGVTAKRDPAKYITDEPTREPIVSGSTLLKVGAGGFLGHALGGVPGAVIGATAAKPVIDKVLVPMTNSAIRATAPALARASESTLLPLATRASQNGALIYEEGPKSLRSLIQEDPNK